MSPKPLVITLAFSALCFASCTKSVAPAVPQFLTRHLGERCEVQFRRDALGAGATVPIPPTTDEMNGAAVAQFGKLIAIEGEGLVIEDALHPDQTYWIPYQVVLSVKFTNKK